MNTATILSIAVGMVVLIALTVPLMGFFFEKIAASGTGKGEVTGTALTHIPVKKGENNWKVDAFYTGVKNEDDRSAAPLNASNVKAIFVLRDESRVEVWFEDQEVQPGERTSITIPDATEVSHYSLFWVDAQGQEHLISGPHPINIE